jgi:hypothetical protein
MMDRRFWEDTFAEKSQYVYEPFEWKPESFFGVLFQQRVKVVTVMLWLRGC